MKKTLMMLPSEADAHEAMEALVGLGESPEDVQVITENHMEPEDFCCPNESLTKTSDMIPGFFRGFGIGLVMMNLGYIFYHIAYTHSSFGISVTVLGFLLAGVIGGWLSMMIGVSVLHPRLKRYMDFVKDGHCLILLEGLGNKNRDKIIQEFPVEMMESY